MWSWIVLKNFLKGGSRPAGLKDCFLESEKQRRLFKGCLWMICFVSVFNTHEELWGRFTMLLLPLEPLALVKCCGGSDLNARLTIF